MKRTIALLFLSVAALVAAASVPAVPNVRVTHLTVEGRTAPLGLDETAPRLSWRIESELQDVQQTAYHLLVASHPDTLTAGRGDLWNVYVGADSPYLSGGVAADPSQSVLVPYGGTPLRPNQRCFWMVRVETTQGASPWSEVAEWGMGLLKEGNWRGQWIGLERAMPWDREDAHSRLSARYYRHTFGTQAPVRRATLHIAGLGLYEAYVDGRRVGAAPQDAAATAGRESHLGETVMAPAPTDYRKSILYDTYDVTALLAEAGQEDAAAVGDTATPAGAAEAAGTARHCIAVTVAPGRFYAMQQHYKPYKVTNFGYPTLRANLIIEYADGRSETVATDYRTWRITADGPVRSANEYDGETYDARREWAMSADTVGAAAGMLPAWTLPGFDDSAWEMAERSALPQGTLRGGVTPPMQVVDTLGVQALVRGDDGRTLLDFGQNVAGWVRLDVGGKGREGDTLRIRYAERLGADGEPYTDNLRQAESTDRYILSGRDSGTWAPRFVTHGFRYAEVALLPAGGGGRPSADLRLGADEAVAEVVADPMRQTGSFRCASPMLNRLIRNARWGIIDNYKGMPVDCPQRDERQPWLGDRAMGCLGESYLMDNHALYAKWLDDIAQAQRSDGVIPDVAPAFWNYYSDNVTWPSVFVFGALMLYQQYGDVRPIERHYDAMRRWLLHFGEDRRDPATGLIKADKYGDWCVAPEAPELIHSQDPGRVTDGVLIGSAYYYLLLDKLATFASLVGRNEDRAIYNKERARIKEAFNRRFLHVRRGTSPQPGHRLYPDSVCYDNGSLTANLLPLAFGLVPDSLEEDVTRQVLAKILLQPADGHLCCGVIGIQWLLRELSRRGRSDVAYLLATQDTYPSWGYMVRQGATTVWELWNGDTANPRMNSGNHVMLLGDLLPWCFENIGGLSAVVPSYSEFILAPDFGLEELPWVELDYESPYGRISSHWQRTADQRLVWDIEVPCNTRANIVLPPNLDGQTIATLGSGRHHLEVCLDPNARIAAATAPPASVGETPKPVRLADVEVQADEFVFLDDATWPDGTTPPTTPFPSTHAATIAELPGGDLLCAYFGGAREGADDVCIYTSRKERRPDGTYAPGWSRPQLAVDGIFRGGDGKPLTAADTLGMTEAERARLFAGPRRAARNARELDGVLRKACYNPVLFQIPGGDLLLFFKVGQNVKDWTGYVVRSHDGGRTWSPKESGLLCGEVQAGHITESDSLLGAIKNKPLWLPREEAAEEPVARGRKDSRKPQPPKGRILAPSSKEAGGWRSYMEVSDDGGATWRLTGPIPQPAEMKTIQPTLLEHADGRLQIICRTQKQNLRLATSWSTDGGETWSEMEYIDGLPSNNSGVDAVTLPRVTAAASAKSATEGMTASQALSAAAQAAADRAAGRAPGNDNTFLLVHNPTHVVPGPDKPLRTPLVVSRSYDGLHWQQVATLEDSPVSQYSYPSAIVGSDGTVHIVYTWRRQRIKYVRLRLPSQ